MKFGKQSLTARFYHVYEIDLSLVKTCDHEYLNQQHRASQYL